MTDEEALRAGLDIKVVWPHGAIQHEHHTRLKGLTQKTQGALIVRPLVLIYIAEIPDNQNGAKVRLFAHLAKADVCIPARKIRI